MLRVALIGTGDAGKHHARALVALAAELHPALAWTAIAARDPARVAAFREELAVPASVATFPSYEALLAAEACDAVILATPDGVHVAQVEAAAAQGLHVLVEKPLALTGADGARAMAAARRAGVRLQVGYHLRHHEAHRVALARLHELVGTLRTVYVRWAWPDPATTGWRAKGEGARFWSLAALGTHGIDLAFLFGGVPPVPEALRVAAVREPSTGIDRAAEVSFTLAGGALAHVSVSVVHRAVSRVVLGGDAGEIEAVGTLGARGDGALVVRRGRAGPEPLAFEPVNPYIAQLRAFVRDAGAGFSEDPAALASLDVVDRIDKETA